MFHSHPVKGPFGVRRASRRFLSFSVPLDRCEMEPIDGKALRKKESGVKPAALQIGET
jgi:hypothetical protein